jgi:protein-S-isoprenylcysteine O-methyltransferase Ste14
MLNTINTIFNHPVARKFFLNLRWLLAFGLLLITAYYALPEWLLPGFAVSMFGQAIQLWSFASLVKNKELTARGPYVMVRNPMYLGRYFLILGFIVATGSWLAIIVYTLFYWFYMANRVAREEKKLAALLGEPYRNYCARVNRFLPDLTRIGDPAVRFFDSAVLRHNNGHWNLLATLVAWVMLVLYRVYLR